MLKMKSKSAQSPIERRQLKPEIVPEVQVVNDVIPSIEVTEKRKEIATEPDIQITIVKPKVRNPLGGKNPQNASKGRGLQIKGNGIAKKGKGQSISENYRVWEPSLC